MEVPAQPFPPPQNEGAGAMLAQLLRFWLRHPLAALGLRECDLADQELDLQKLEGLPWLRGACVYRLAVDKLQRDVRSSALMGPPLTMTP